MESAGNFIFIDAKGSEADKGEGKVVLGTETLELRPRAGGSRPLSYRDMVAITSAHYQLEIILRDGCQLKMSHMGRAHDDLVRELHSARNALAMSDLLMSEKVRKQGVKGELRPFRGAEGPCEVRLYDTALLVLPLKHSLLRFRYSDIEGIEAANYQLRIALESGELLTLAMLGRELDPLWKGISDAMAEQEEAARAVVKDAWPAADQETLTAASRMLREGRAAGRREIEGLAPELWKGLEAKVGAMGLEAEYAHLSSLGLGNMTRIGLKRSLSEEEGEYIWFMMPILGKGGNAVAMEATSAAGAGRATYFFRIAPRSAYPKLGEEQRREEAERCMDILTTGLREVNFRRQPIFLKDQQLLQPPFSRYRFSVSLIPSLRELRSRFIGRVPHTSEEEWKAKIADLLSFNTGAKDDLAKWSAGEEFDDLDN